MVQSTARLVILFVLLLPAFASAQTNVDADERGRLVTRLDAIRGRFKVPAFAITVVESDA